MDSHSNFRLSSLSSSSRPLSSSMSNHSSGSCAFKLGDFSRLDISNVSSPAPIHSSTKSPSLGNFSKVFSHFGTARLQLRSTDLIVSPPSGPTQEEEEAADITTHPEFHSAGNTAHSFDENMAPSWPPVSDTDSSSDSGSDVGSVLEVADTYDTPATSPSSSPRRDHLPTPEKDSLWYTMYPNGPLRPVVGSGRYQKELETHASEELIASFQAIQRGDKYTYRKCPTIDKNGIHIFVDMSNIHISFIKTLKEKFNLPPNARFSPNPYFNIEQFTLFLQRGRPVRSLHAGCSVHPDRSLPSFIEKLRTHGYRVDVRERKRTQEPKFGNPSNGDRYVEDLVDETLQTRIGETVMKHHEEKGTLVLVTGDAKPAPYSDGFFEYARRALAMGWHVEVVSWKASCSSLWKDPAFTGEWGHRFRLIELDPFLSMVWRDEPGWTPSSP